MHVNVLPCEMSCCSETPTRESLQKWSRRSFRKAFRTKASKSGRRVRRRARGDSIGAGPLVSGLSKQLLLVMAGRPSAIDSLTGEGVATMRSR